MGEESNSHRTIGAIFIFKYLRTDESCLDTDACSQNESNLSSCLQGADISDHTKYFKDVLEN
jgi:hypothetical protein